MLKLQSCNNLAASVCDGLHLQAPILSDLTHMKRCEAAMATLRQASNAMDDNLGGSESELYVGRFKGQGQSSGSMHGQQIPGSRVQASRMWSGLLCLDDNLVSLESMVGVRVGT